MFLKYLSTQAPCFKFLDFIAITNFEILFIEFKYVS